jgi:hypothetical protein
VSTAVRALCEVRQHVQRIYVLLDTCYWNQFHTGTGDNSGISGPLWLLATVAPNPALQHPPALLLILLLYLRRRHRRCCTPSTARRTHRTASWPAGTPARAGGPARLRHAAPAPPAPPAGRRHRHTRHTSRYIRTRLQEHIVRCLGHACTQQPRAAVLPAAGMGRGRRGRVWCTVIEPPPSLSPPLDGPDGGVVIDALRPPIHRALEILRQFEWVGLTDAMEPSLCLLHYQANRTLPAQCVCVRLGGERGATGAAGALERDEVQEARSKLAGGRDAGSD